MRTAIAAALVLALGCEQGDGDSGRTRDAKIELAGRQVGQLAFEAYPMWAVRMATVDRCPTLDELREFVPRVPIDPWGRPLRLRCDDLPPGAYGVAIWSVGPDGKDQTSDDVHAKYHSKPGAD